MKKFVRHGCLCSEAELKAWGVDMAEYVEVVAHGAGRCRRARLVDVVPDLAAALSGINASIITLAEQLEELRCGIS